MGTSCVWRPATILEWEDFWKLCRSLWFVQSFLFISYPIFENISIINNIKYLQGTVKDVHAFVINNDLEELENKIEATSPIVLYGKDGNGLNVLHKVRRITILNNLFFFKSYDSIINRLVAWDTRRSRGTSSRNSPPLWKRRTTTGRHRCITRLQPRMMELCTICWSSTEPMKVNWITWVHEFYNYIIYKNF